jgi:arylsulfatase A-like enzyme
MKPKSNPENQQRKADEYSRRQFINHAAMASAGMAFAPWLNACARGKARPNILYILADQWRASATGYAGDLNVRTPNLDKLAKESMLFRNAVSVCPVCTPYRASLMTGRYPTSTGMFLNDAHLPDGELCLAEVLSGEGYHTAYIGKWHLDGHGRSSYIPPERRQGFEYWKGAECDHNYNHSHYYTGTSDKKKFWEGYDVYAQTDDARNFLKDHSADDNPFALFVSYGTPHFPHETAPEEYKAHYPPEKIRLPGNVPESMREEALKEAQGYYAHCEALDKSIGELLKTLEKNGLKESTILVFTSDHGEMLGAQGFLPKTKQVPWSEAANVPFLLRYPVLHGNAGRVVDMPLTTPDIFPTLLGLSGIEIPATVEGKDHSPVIRKGIEPQNSAALYMGVAPFTRQDCKAYRAIRTSRFTYVRAVDGPWLLFDDVKDPLQMDNLVKKPEHAPLLEKMDKLLQDKLREIGDDFRPPESYITEWGYQPASHGSVPYFGDDLKPQTPVRQKSAM